MRLVAATVYALRIPFVESFAHSLKERRSSDSVVVRVRDEMGTEGFGEGVPRPYVTGETADIMVEHLARDLWPAVADRALPEVMDATTLGVLEALIPFQAIAGAIADNASRAALKLAMLDCTLRRQKRSLADVLPPRRRKVVYSGVITAGSLDKTLQHARQMKLVGFKQIKLKVGTGDDVARVQAVREVMGPEVSLRLDANGAWSLNEATQDLNAVAAFNIAAVEEPLPRDSLADLKELKRACQVPIMVDESLVTHADAEALVAARAVDYFNVRVSKCGGLGGSAEIARLAAQAGIGVQVGSQVGETSILAAAGRGLAAWLLEVAFVEGSFGTLLLVEDVTAESVRFGHRGEAPILTGPGLGVQALDDRLRKYAQKVVELA